MASGPLDYGNEVSAAQILKQLSEYTSALVRQEIHRAQQEGNIPPEQLEAPSGPYGPGGLLALIGVGSLMMVGAAGLAGILVRRRSG